RTNPGASARAYGKQGNHPAAIACCQEAIALQPDCTGAYQVLGDMLQATGKPAPARRAYEKVLELAPDSLAVHYQLALLHQQQGDPHGAIACYQTLLALQPHLPEAHSNLGNLLAEVGQLDEAVACFQIALRLKPDYLKAHRHCGYLLYLQGNLDEALTHFEQVLQMQPDCVMSLCHCARILLEKGEAEEAVQRFHHVLQQERSPFLPAYLTWVQQTEGVARERGEFLATLSEEPDAAPVYRFLGKFLSRKNNYEAAIAAFERSLALAPEVAIAHRLLADTCAQVEQYDRAVSGYRQSLSLDPDDAETYFNFGVVLAQLDKRYERSPISKKQRNSNLTIATAPTTWASIQTSRRNSTALWQSLMRLYPNPHRTRFGTPRGTGSRRIN
ncbi:MAG: tetratricopeptide repeat protein, partial [Coleofasciculaceae cyanobacterium SM2_3_26]|nr:tetratricopeptide repeat protein [Coleofasciculaceae cyanobacterium SM2_3_26]